MTPVIGKAGTIHIEAGKDLGHGFVQAKNDLDVPDRIVGGNCDSVLGPYGLFAQSGRFQYRGKLKTYSRFLKNSIANAGLDLLDLFKSCSFVKTPNEEIDVARRRKLPVIILP